MRAGRHFRRRMTQGNGMRIAGGMLVVWVTASGALCAAQEATRGDDQQGRRAAAEATHNTDRGNGSGSKKPAETFKPSERIRADSAVSFPVDI